MTRNSLALTIATFALLAVASGGQSAVAGVIVAEPSLSVADNAGLPVDARLADSLKSRLDRDACQQAPSGGTTSSPSAPSSSSAGSQAVLSPAFEFAPGLAAKRLAEEIEEKLPSPPPTGLLRPPRSDLS